MKNKLYILLKIFQHFDSIKHYENKACKSPVNIFYLAVRYHQLICVFFRTFKICLLCILFVQRVVALCYLFLLDITYGSFLQNRNGRKVKRYKRSKCNFAFSCIGSYARRFFDLEFGQPNNFD